jgi:hypothetical protein
MTSRRRLAAGRILLETVVQREAREAAGDSSLAASALGAVYLTLFSW